MESVEPAEVLDDRLAEDVVLHGEGFDPDARVHLEKGNAEPILPESFVVGDEGTITATFDVVVTVCDRAREACPVFPGARATVHWSLEDPAAVDGPGAEVAAAFDRTATEIEARLGPFIAAVSGRGESAPTSSS